MSYYWFNRQESLQKGKDRYHNYGGKEKPAEYYLEIRGRGEAGVGLKGNAKNKFRKLSEEKIEIIKEVIMI